MLRGIISELIDRFVGAVSQEKLSPKERRELFDEILDAQAKIIAELMQAFASFPNGIRLFRIAQLFQSEPTLKDRPSLSDIEIHGMCHNKIYYTTYSSKNHQNPYLRTYDDKTRLVSQGEVLQTAYERQTQTILAIRVEAITFADHTIMGQQQLEVLILPVEESRTADVDYWQEALRKRGFDIDLGSIKVSRSREERIILNCSIQGVKSVFHELAQESPDKRVMVCLREKPQRPHTKNGHPIRPNLDLPALVRA